jgi:hypothetical protein
LHAFLSKSHPGAEPARKHKIDDFDRDYADYMIVFMMTGSAKRP